jgi:hypothetical protein
VSRRPVARRPTSHEPTAGWKKITGRFACASMFKCGSMAVLQHPARGGRLYNLLLVVARPNGEKELLAVENGRTGSGREGTLGLCARAARAVGPRAASGLAGTCGCAVRGQRSPGATHKRFSSERGLTKEKPPDHGRSIDDIWLLLGKSLETPEENSYVAGPVCGRGCRLRQPSESSPDSA